MRLRLYSLFFRFEYASEGIIFSLYGRGFVVSDLGVLT